MKRQIGLVGFFLLSIFTALISAQDQVPEPDTVSLRKDAVRFFLDCRRCDEDYIRKEIPYVNYVRDVKEAQVYSLMTSQPAGNGGREYTFTFEGQQNFKGMNDTLSFTSMPDDTRDKRREGQLQMLKLGLMRYVARTPLYSEISISHTGSLEEEEVIDRWNNWVFELSFSPWFEGEETYKELDFYNSASARRITENWKVELDFDHEYERKSYDYEDTSYTAFSNGAELENLIVKSINEHWSVGGEINLRTATYNNFNFQTEIIPSLEYNIFPYSESTRRQLRMLYGIGYSHNIYNDTTIYGKTREGLFLQSFKLGYEVTQKWGSIDVGLRASNYLHDFSKNRISFGGRIDIRIVKGLSLRMFGQVARVRDQISLANEELTEAEILLRLQEVATGYTYFGGIGISYTFGSIYNNIVNPRFGRY
jgi:hypothetical protein